VILRNCEDKPDPEVFPFFLNQDEVEIHYCVFNLSRVKQELKNLNSLKLSGGSILTFRSKPKTLKSVRFLEIWDSEIGSIHRKCPNLRRLKVVETLGQKARRLILGKEGSSDFKNLKSIHIDKSNTWTLPESILERIE